MATISSETINEIRNSVDIVDVIGKYLTLTKRGKNYFTQCPFHEDKTPSLSVSSEKQIFTCFSCHRAGNVFNFLMEYDNLTFLESVKMTADMAGIALDIKTERKTNVNNHIFDIYDISQKFYLNNINTSLGKPAKEYLNKRSITDELIKEFNIGLAIKKVDALSNLLQKKEFNEKDLIESALVIKDDRGFHDFFYDRIIFPLYDINNRVVGYSGRLYNNDDGPKYINSKEHSLFKKGEFLFNYYKAKEECRKKDCVIITEGFMDVIRCYQAGVKNVIATMGTAFTKNHVTLIKKLASNVLLCFDGDKAGVKATFASCDELVKSNIIPKIIVLEEKLDPDEYILKYGKEKFQEKIDNPMSLMDFKLLYHKKNIDINSLEDKANYVNTIIKELNLIEDEVLREMTIKKLSTETDLEIDFLKSKLNNIEKKEIIIKPNLIKTNKYIQAQAGLIYYMLKSKDIIKIVDNKSVFFPDKEYRLLSNDIIYFNKKNNYIDIADFLTNTSPNNINLIGFIETLGFNDEFTENIVYDYIKAIFEKNINDECERLTKKLDNETDIDKKIKISQQIFDLIARREKDV